MNKTTGLNVYFGTRGYGKTNYELEQKVKEYKSKLQEQVPTFVKGYIKTEIEQKKLIRCRSIINFVLSGKTKKTKELASLLEDALYSYIRSIK